MSAKKNPAADYALIAPGMSACACSAALRRTRDVAAGPAGTAKASISEINQLAAYARRIEACLVQGSARPHAARLDWANAVVLMDSLANEAINATSADRAAYQKSGSTG